MKRLSNIYKDAASKYGDVIKVKEDALRAEKRAHGAEFYYDLAPVLANALPYERIAKDEWHNKTFKPKNHEDEIIKEVQRITGDIKAIEDSCGEWADQCKVIYMRTLDLSEAMAEKTRLKEIAERTRRMDEERAAIKAEQEAAAQAPAPAPEAPEQPAQAPVIPQAPPAPVTTTTVSKSPEGDRLSFTLRFEGERVCFRLFHAELRRLLARHPEISCTDINKGGAK
jgi:hypothetical protein